jgi:GNAT superfamily N-acetyltransferase
MKIFINETTEKDIENFCENAWRGEDIEHYGKPIHWVVKKFIFKATEDGKIVGVAIGKYESGVIFIDTIIVMKDKRGQGIGTKIVKKVEKFGKKLGGHKIYLFTMEKWEASRFYQKLGYKKTGDLLHHYLRKDFTIYSKEI